MTGGVRLGLRANAAQFGVLVVVSALVGGMVGQERTVLPLLAGDAFGLRGFASALTFIVAFGVTKAITNVVAGAHGLSVGDIGVLAAAYPAVWAVAQVGTGALSDRTGRKPLIVAGMLLQAGAIAVIAAGSSFGVWLAAAVALGLGTALVYPTLLAAVADVAEPRWRGAAIGVYRLWRDLGFAIGALVAGILADAFGMPAAIGAVAALTAISGLIVIVRMAETRVPTAA